METSENFSKKMSICLVQLMKNERGWGFNYYPGKNKSSISTTVS